MFDKQEIKRFEEFYLRAALEMVTHIEGYKADPMREGAIVFEYKEDDLRFLDTNYGNKFDWRNHGIVHIWYRDILVWYMFYRGRIHKKERDFLRRVLAEAYREGQFNGGRGPTKLISFGNLEYKNSPQGDFKRFHGVEQILEDGRVCSETNYQGELLVLS